MTALERLDAAWKAVDPDSWLDLCTDGQWGITLQGSIILWPHARHHVADTLAEAIASAQAVVEALEPDGRPLMEVLGCTRCGYPFTACECHDQES